MEKKIYNITDTANLKGRKVFIPRLDSVGVVEEQLPSGEIKTVAIDGNLVDVINDVVELIPTVWELIKLILRKFKF